MVSGRIRNHHGMIVCYALIIFLLLPWKATAEQLRVGVLRLTSSAPIFIAQEEGFFGQEGLALDLKFMESAQPVAVALASGDIDIGATGLTAGLYNALAGGLDARIVADKGRVWPGYRLVAIMVSNRAWDAGLRDLRKLEGRKVGVTQIGSTFHYMLGRLLQQQGIPISKVRVTPLGGLKQMMDAVASNSIEAAFMAQPSCTMMEEKKMGRIMLWADDHISYQLGGIFMSGRIANDESKAIPFLRAYIRGCRFYHDNCLKLQHGKPVKGPEFDRIINHISKHTGREPAFVAAGLNYNDRNGQLMADDIRTQINWFHENALLERRPDPTKIVDTSLLKKALDGLPGK